MPICLPGLYSLKTWQVKYRSGSFFLENETHKAAMNTLNQIKADKTFSLLILIFVIVRPVFKVKNILLAKERNVDFVKVQNYTNPEFAQK